MEKTQTCRRCGLDKTRDQYHPGKWGQRGNYCRTCCAQYQRERRPGPKREPKPLVPCGCGCGLLAPRGQKYRALCSPVISLSERYAAVHARVQRERGRASDYTCGCGDRAEQWAYDHADPTPLVGPTSRGRVVEYSMDTAHYVALCLPCHVWLDMKMARFRRGVSLVRPKLIFPA